MIDVNARANLINYLNNKHLTQSLEKGFGQLKDNIKIDDEPLRETANAIGQQSVQNAFTMALLESIDQTNGEILDQLKELNQNLRKEKDANPIQ